jgi:protein subunit release factor B
LPGPQQLRQQEKREQKLKEIREQVAQGKLVIRRMTAEERTRYPRREVGAARRGSRRYS